MAIVNIDRDGERVAMISADYFTRDELDWLESAARRAAGDDIAAGLGTCDVLTALARKLAFLARGPSAA